ncbi:MAG TPA: trypsin-like peptidase domain-containing protein [Jiangellaceae bacterium]|nr:trypsin-like peptidase domain-containing protein [Jiangellaceae bacterium]
MDETTRSTQPTGAALDEGRAPDAPDAPTGSGWSTPTGSGQQPPPPADPWTARPDDTRSVARPEDTQTFQPPSYPAGGEPPFAGPAPEATGGRQPRRGTALMVALALGAGVLGGAAGAGVVSVLDDDQAPAVSNSLDPAPSGQQTSTFSEVEDVAAQVLPSVVSIAVRGPQGSGTGSGVIISSDGQILTNNHVVEGGGELTVTFHDGTTASAEVVGTDPTTDLAVIQAQDVSGLTAAELGSSGDLQVGQQVVAIGSPFGLDGTVTTGIVSAVGRPVSAGDGQGSGAVIDAIQTDAPINPGNSGGPLVNMSGQVVGINSAIYAPSAQGGSIGLGFSIPIDQARPIVDELIESGQATHARIGLSVGNTTGETSGALVAEVENGSGADEAGLAEGDVITKIDDRIITDGTSLVAAARSYRPGDTVTLTYVRDGETQTVDVTLGSDSPST